MTSSNGIFEAWRRLKGQFPRSEPPNGVAATGYVPVDRSPTAFEEFQAFDQPTIYDPAEWPDPEVQARLLKNADYRNDILEKKKFAKHAYRLNRIWIFFLIGVTVLQGTHLFGFHVDRWGFRTIFVSTTASVFGFALLVGKYLFPSNGRSR